MLAEPVQQCGNHLLLTAPSTSASKLRLNLGYSPPTAAVMDIDEQFDRAVSIVQGLPKSGPIQTEYEEKLAMYSLFKQATTGDVNSSRPAIWDVMNRAKWDAWQQYKGTSKPEAKRLYVQTLSRILMKHSDKSLARDLIQSLELNSRPGNVGPSSAISASFAKAPSSSSSSSSGSSSDDDDNLEPEGEVPSATVLPYPPHLQPSLRGESLTQDLTSEEEGSHMGGVRHMPLPIPASQIRPPSAISSHQRYRTPMIINSPQMYPTAPGMPTVPEIPVYRQPQVQPMPMYSTPSSFDREARIPSIPFYTSPPAAIAHYSSGAGIYPSGTLPPIEPPNTTSSRLASLEGRLTVLMERVERLEDDLRRSRSLARSSFSSINTNRWNPTEMGLWSIVATPLVRGWNMISMLIEFLLGPTYAHGPAHPGLTHPSPILVIVRRLSLDASFILTVFTLTKYIIRRNGIRRHEIRAAFKSLFMALLGRGSGSGDRNRA